MTTGRWEYRVFIAAVLTTGCMHSGGGGGATAVAVR